MNNLTKLKLLYPIVHLGMNMIEKKKVKKKRVKLAWKRIDRADIYVVKIKQKTRGKAKATFEVASSSASLRGLTRKAKYKVRIFGKSGADRSQTSKAKFRTK